MVADAILSKIDHRRQDVVTRPLTLFANKRANRLKVLVHDGIGIWLAARRLQQGKFVWPAAGQPSAGLCRAQLDALVLGLPWQRVGPDGVITMI